MLALGTYEIALRGRVDGQRWQVGRTVYLTGTGLATLDAVGVAAAWWDGVKADWRALAPEGVSTAFESIQVRELGVAVPALGTYPIPSVERDGTRTSTGTEYMPSFVACGVQLTVATVLTRPGQMRLPFLFESDVSSNIIGSLYLTAAEAVAEWYVGQHDFGALLDSVTIQNRVVRLSPDDGTVVVAQPITGYIVNPYVTSQVSRKVGRGT